MIAVSLLTGKTISADTVGLMAGKMFSIRDTVGL
jgi:hypothetical protein